MINLFRAFALVTLIAVGIVGCSSGSPSDNTTDVNQFLEFKTGDKFTYNSYDRDASNQRVESSKEVVVWTVLRSGLDTLGKSEVAEIEAVTYETDGTTEKGRTKLYFSANGQGHLFQYNLIQSVVGRFDNETVQALIDSIPDAWIQISDTKTTVDDSWSYAGAGNIKKSISIGDFQGQMTLDVNSYHNGKVTTSVEAGEFTKTVNTDNNVTLHVTAASLTAVSDSMSVHFDVDIDGGILKESLDSKTITVTILQATEYEVNGFEMELVSVTRAEN